MNWILSSFLMFISSVFLYLFIRKSSLLKIPTQLVNLASFTLPLFFYLAITISTKGDLSITPYQFFIIVIASFFFSYLGNVFSLKSIEYAPNPGYSLIISKSYVVFTTLVSVFLFHSVLTLRTSLAIFFIVLFSAFVMIDRKTKSKSHVRSVWLPLSMGSFFCWGMLALASKYLLIIGLSVLSRLVYLTAIVSIFILFEMRHKKTDWKFLSKTQMLCLFGIGLLSTGFNYFMQQGFNTAPNIGYVNAINASSIAVVSLFSTILFKDELTKQKLIGIIGVTIGLILLVF